MKKNLLYLFTVLCTLGLTTACGDDDEPTVDESWKELAGTYEGTNKLALTLNSVQLWATDGRTVVFSPSSETAGTVKLNNVMPEQASVDVPVTMTKSGNNYSITGSGVTAGIATVGVEGTIDSDGKLTANVTRSVASTVTGKFNLNYVEGLGDIYVEATIADPTYNALINQMAPGLIGGALAGKVSAVTVDLSDKGTMSPTWTKVGETTPTTMASIPNVGPMFGTVINMYYTVMGNKLFIGLDKGLLTNPALAAFFPTLKEKIGIDITTLTAMMADMNGFLWIPLNFKQENDLTTFYADKELIMGIVNSGMLNSLIPAEYATLLPIVMPLLQSAETVNIGLRFKK